MMVGARTQEGGNVYFDAVTAEELGTLRSMQWDNDQCTIEVDQPDGGVLTLPPFNRMYVFDGFPVEECAAPVWELRLHDQRVTRIVVGGIRI